MIPYADLRSQVVKACIQLADLGYLVGTGGNVALRTADGLFAVTPSGLDYYAMLPDDICILELGTLRVVAGTKTPSVESGLHARVFKARPDAQASVHTHQPLASAVALLGVSIPVEEASDRDALGPRIESVGYGPSGTGFLVRALGARLRPGINAYLLRNHGLVCAGRTLDEAVAHTRRVERVAAQFLRQAITATGADLDGLVHHALSH
jgi:L-fuculose-phosphate aldolase